MQYPERRDALLSTEASGGISNALKSVLLAALAAGGALAVKSILTQVPSGHIGLRTHNGKVLNSKGKPYGFEAVGLRKKWPLISDIKKVDLRERVTPIGDKIYTLKDRNGAKVQLSTNVAVSWRLLHGVDENDVPYAYRQFMMLADGEKGLESKVSTLVASGIAKAAGNLEDIRYFANEGYVLNRVNELCEAQLRNYGAILMGVNFTQATDSPAQTLGDILSQAIASPHLSSFTD